MEEHYIVVAQSSGVVMESVPFVTAAEALARAREIYGNTGIECYAGRLVPVALDKKSSLVILREQTAAIASTTTSTATRTEQIYFELQQLRQALMDALALIQEEVLA